MVAEHPGFQDVTPDVDQGVVVALGRGADIGIDLFLGGAPTPILTAMRWFAPLVIGSA